MMKKIAAIGISVFCAATLFAADTPQAEDSPLVRAAKIAAAKRQQLAAQGQIIIDDAHLKSSTGHITVNSGAGAPLPQTPRPQGVPKVIVIPSTTLSPAERAKLEKKVEELKKERLAMADENDQPYSAEGNEDQAAKRLNEIQKELADAEKKLAAPAQPSRPPQ
jgi:hypothetical protein